MLLSVAEDFRSLSVCQKHERTDAFSHALINSVCILYTSRFCEIFTIVDLQKKNLFQQNLRKKTTCLQGYCVHYERFSGCL